MRSKVRIFLTSFIITLVILGLVMGLTTADYNTRSISGSLGNGSVVAFSPSNEGLDVKVFDNVYRLNMPGFLKNAKDTLIGWYANAKNWLLAYPLNPQYHAAIIRFLEKQIERIVKITGI